jgi:tetratricopeptide (TPR) repeat protein
MYRILLSPLLFLLFFGCSQTPYMKGHLAAEKGDYETAEASLYEEIKENPDSYRAWRELGIVYYHQENYEKAEEALKQANVIRPDARAYLYLGLIQEQRRQYDKATAAYAAAEKLRPEGRTRELIHARLEVLIDKQFQHEASLAIRNETAIDVDTIPDNAVAVVNFDGSSLPQEMMALALGLAEFTAVDLAKISSLRVVDRIKINVILDELRISQSHYADTNIAPRVGRLLGSRQLVVGKVISSGNNDIRLEGALVNVIDSTISRTETNEGALNRFFNLQKDFVFDLIDTLGISLTREERDAIEEVPTESFLAFMAYSQGLYYQRRGLYETAENYFRNAVRLDAGFKEAAVMSDRMAKMVAFEAEGDAGEGARTSQSFEEQVLATMEIEDQEVDLDYIQNINLTNSGFIYNGGIYLRYGSSPIAPPGGGPIREGTGIIIIEGNFDVD